MTQRFYESLALLAAVALLAAAPLPASAEPWWKRGTEILKNLGDASNLSTSEIAAGLKEALRIGSERVVARLGRPGGFELDPAVRIQLPETLASVQTALQRVGLAGTLDDLERKLNEAAEIATPKALGLLLQAITDMTLGDARQILAGPSDAATRYFERKMSAPLAGEMAPLVRTSLREVGAFRAYDDAMASYDALPFVPEVNADLTGYVVEKGMRGIFHYLALAEAAIRTDPAARTTELLRNVFAER